MSTIKKIRWTKKDVQNYFSKPVEQKILPSRKAKQQYNIISKYVQEGKLSTDNPKTKAYLRDFIINEGRGVRTQQVITGLHPNVEGTIKTSKLGRVTVKASDSANMIDYSEIKNKKFYSSGDFPQRGGQHNVFGFSPKTDEMIVAYENKKHKTSVNYYDEVPGEPRKAQHNMMFVFDDRLPMFIGNEKTIEFNAEWQKKYRDTYGPGRKVKFPNEKVKREYINNLRNAEQWDENSVIPHHSVVKSNEKHNQKAYKQWQELHAEAEHQRKIEENTRKYRESLRKEYEAPQYEEYDDE